MTDHEAELTRLIWAMAEKVATMSEHLTRLAERKADPVADTPTTPAPPPSPPAAAAGGVPDPGARREAERRLSAYYDGWRHGAGLLAIEQGQDGPDFTRGWVDGKNARNAAEQAEAQRLGLTVRYCTIQGGAEERP